MEPNHTQGVVAKVMEGKLLNKKVLVNISGQLFVTTAQTLSKYPDTKLGRLIETEPATQNFFFESDAEIFKEILKFYITDELHCPKNVCFNGFKKHLEWWGIETKYLAFCCSREMNEEMELEEQFKYYDKTATIKPGSRQTFSFSIWSFLTDPCGNQTRCKLGAKIWAVIYFAATLISGGCISALTLPSVLEPSANVNSTDETGSHSLASNNRDFGNQLCTDYILSRSTKAVRVLGATHLSLTLFYAIEIWTRFTCCPDKDYFRKSINGLDMTISLFETAVTGYMFFFLYIMVPDYAEYSNFLSVCKASVIIERVVFIVGQMRFLRLLGYASVYRYMELEIFC